MTLNPTLNSPLWSIFPWLPVMLAGLYGTLVGSFLNVVIYRLPAMLTHRSSDTGQTFNLAWPPSSCPSCKSHIRVRHNIPILGWISLKGKCYDCGTTISARYPAIEAVTGFLIGLTAWLAQTSPQTSLCHAIIFMCLFSALIAVAAIAYDTGIVPGKLSAPLILVGIIFSALTAGPDDFSLLTKTLVPEDSLIGSVLGVVIPWCGIQLYGIFTNSASRRLSANQIYRNGEWLLLGVAGAWLGWESLPKVAFITVFFMVAAATCISRPRDSDERVSEVRKLNMGASIAVSTIVVALLQLYWHSL